MNIDASKVAKIEFRSACIALPFVFWLAMYVAPRW